MRPITTFRNPILSLWQSAIHKVVATKYPLAAARMSSEHPMMTQFVAMTEAFTRGTPPPLSDALGNTISACAQLVAELAWAETTRNTKRVAELTNELRMSTCDPEWIEALDAYLAFKAQGGAIPYIRYQSLDDFVIPIPDDVVIAFIADWGTGAEDAAWLLSQVMLQKPDILIHLGDIYYAGTLDEVGDNFLDIVQAQVGNIPVYTLSGNHDMYSGGGGYYSLLKKLNQPASYFCLRNDSWQFLAMDTGLNDADPFSVASNVTYLDPAEVTWHLDKLQNAGGRKTVLLSHHQLFSAAGLGEDTQGRQIGFNPHLLGSFREALDRGQVALWLWGHEHNLVVFDPYLNLPQGRCIGSGAIPVLTDQNPYTPNPNLDLQGQSAPPTMNLKDAQLSANADGFYYHAYAIMTLSGDKATVQYYQVDSIDNGGSEPVFCELAGEPGTPC